MQKPILESGAAFCVPLQARGDSTSWQDPNLVQLLPMPATMQERMTCLQAFDQLVLTIMITGEAAVVEIFKLWPTCRESKASG